MIPIKLFCPVCQSNFIAPFPNIGFEDLEWDSKTGGSRTTIIMRCDNQHQSELVIVMHGQEGTTLSIIPTEPT